MAEEDLQSFFKRLLKRVFGLQAIVISDRDGVTLTREAKEDYSDEASEASLSATFAVATEQASKLRMGKNQTITSFYNNRIIVHVNHSPLIISLIGDSTLNVGMILSFSSEIKNALDPLKSNVKESEIN